MGDFRLALIFFQQCTCSHTYTHTYLSDSIYILNIEMCSKMYTYCTVVFMCIWTYFNVVLIYIGVKQLLRFCNRKYRDLHHYSSEPSCCFLLHTYLVFFNRTYFVESTSKKSCFNKKM